MDSGLRRNDERGSAGAFTGLPVGLLLGGADGVAGFGVEEVDPFAVDGQFDGSSRAGERRGSIRAQNTAPSSSASSVTSSVRSVSAAARVASVSTRGASTVNMR